MGKEGLAMDQVIYLLTDGRKEDVLPFVEKACQLAGLTCPIYSFGPIIQPSSFEEVLNRMREEEKNVILFHALEESGHREEVHVFSIREGIPSYDMLSPILTFLMKAGKRELVPDSLLHRDLDPATLDHLLAYDFARRFDDGQDPRGIHYADLVLIGISRTMKTPLTLYLASQKIRVVNVPLLPELVPPAELFRINSKKVVGLTVSPGQLLALRQERLKSLGLPPNSAYASLKRIREELEYADQVMKQIGCPVVDVTDKAVEEIAEIILTLRDDEEDLG